METSLRNVPWGSSARDHLLSNYKASLIAIMLAQFDRHKGFADGMQARPAGHPSRSTTQSTAACTTTIYEACMALTEA